MADSSDALIEFGLGRGPPMRAPSPRSLVTCSGPIAHRGGTARPEQVAQDEFSSRRSFARGEEALTAAPSDAAVGGRLRASRSYAEGRAAGRGFVVSDGRMRPRG